MQTLGRAAGKKCGSRRAVTSVDWATYPISHLSDVPPAIDVILINRRGRVHWRRWRTGVARSQRLSGNQSSMQPASGFGKYPFTPERVKAAPRSHRTPSPIRRWGAHTRVSAPFVVLHHGEKSRSRAARRHTVRRKPARQSPEPRRNGQHTAGPLVGVVIAVAFTLDRSWAVSASSLAQALHELGRPLPNIRCRHSCGSISRCRSCRSGQHIPLPLSPVGGFHRDECPMTSPGVNVARPVTPGRALRPSTRRNLLDARAASSS